MRAARGVCETRALAILPQTLEGLFYEFPGAVRFMRSPEGIASEVEEYGPDVVMFDLTSLEASIVESVRSQTRCLASVSPIFDQMSHMDLSFTRTPRFEPIEGVTTYGGLKYTIFNDYCVRITDDIFHRNNSRDELPVAICLGGADSANKTQLVLDALVQISVPCTFWTLLGQGYEHSYSSLAETVRNTHHHEVVLANTSRSMWTVMGNCVLAVTAGGLTAMEAVYSGLPAITLLREPAHRELLTHLFDVDAVLDGGSFDDASLSRLKATIEQLHGDRAELAAWRKRCQGLIDDNGPARVLNVLQKHLDDS